MILDYIKSTIENIRERIKNPFTERNATPLQEPYYRICYL